MVSGVHNIECAKQPTEYMDKNVCIYFDVCNLRFMQVWYTMRVGTYVEYT